MMFMNVDVCFFVKCISSKNMTKCVYIYIYLLILTIEEMCVCVFVHVRFSVYVLSFGCKQL